MRKLKIAQLSTPFFSVPPKNYGAIEYIAYLLTEELVKRGHEVTLLATGESKTSGSLISIYEKELRPVDAEALFSPLAYKLPWMQSLPSLLHINKLMERADEFDVIHNHFHYLPLFFSNLIKTPMVNTYHGNFLYAAESPIELSLLEHYKRSNWVAISESQKRNCPVDLSFSGVIYHGIDLSKYAYDRGGREYLAWLGRINPQKGITEAIKVAKAVGKKLVIAGIVNKRDEDFFKKEVEPHLGDGVEYIGPISSLEKSKMLGEALALLYPVTWDEPFGLVMIEAMATGTPVIGFNKGAVPEVVIDGQTGFVVQSTEQMIEAVRKIGQIDRSACRRHVEEKFTVEKMVDGYEEVYRQVLGI